MFRLVLRMALGSCPLSGWPRGWLHPKQLCDSQLDHSARENFTARTGGKDVKASGFHFGGVRALASRAARRFGAAAGAAHVYDGLRMGHPASAMARIPS